MLLRSFSFKMEHCIICVATLQAQVLKNIGKPFQSLNSAFSAETEKHCL